MYNLRHPSDGMREARGVDAHRRYRILHCIALESQRRLLVHTRYLIKITPTPSRLLLDGRRRIGHPACSPPDEEALDANPAPQTNVTAAKIGWASRRHIPGQALPSGLSNCRWDLR